MIDGKTVNKEIVQAHLDLRALLDHTRTQVQRLPQGDEARRDLMILIQNIEASWSKLDNEMIVCRWRNKQTPRYIELASMITDHLQIVKREVFWRKLH